LPEKIQKTFVCRNEMKNEKKKHAGNIYIYFLVENGTWLVHLVFIDQFKPDQAQLSF
jgi:hypothetical protein